MSGMLPYTACGCTRVKNGNKRAPLIPCHNTEVIYIIEALNQSHSVAQNLSATVSPRPRPGLPPSWKLGLNLAFCRQLPGPHQHLQAFV